MKRCLVVDDAQVIRRITRSILESLRYEVIEADNAQTAFDLYSSQRPDVVILDWHMPGAMSAMEFLSAVRTSRLPFKSHIIYCTTDNDPIDIQKALNHGADDYLIKPFVREMLQAKLPSERSAA